VLTDTLTIDRHKTALVRTDLSRPVRLALEHGLVPEGVTAFDYGCGHGGDVARLGLVVEGLTAEQMSELRAGIPRG